MGPRDKKRWDGGELGWIIQKEPEEDEVPRKNRPAAMVERSKYHDYLMDLIVVPSLGEGRSLMTQHWKTTMEKCLMTEQPIHCYTSKKNFSEGKTQDATICIVEASDLVATNATDPVGRLAG